MAEITNELIYELLKRMQDRLGQMDGKLDNVAAEMRAIKVHQVGFMQSELTQDTQIAELVTRLQRIERRLDLVD